MVAERVEPPKKRVESEGHPAKGLVVAHLERCKHPAKLRPTQSSIKGIFDQSVIVIPFYEPVPQRWIKNPNRREKNHKRRQPAGQSRCQAAARPRFLPNGDFLAGLRLFHGSFHKQLL